MHTGGKLDSIYQHDSTYSYQSVRITSVFWCCEFVQLQYDVRLLERLCLIDSVTTANWKIVQLCSIAELIRGPRCWFKLILLHIWQYNLQTSFRHSHWWTFISNNCEHGDGGFRAISTDYFSQHSKNLGTLCSWRLRNHGNVSIWGRFHHESEHVKQFDSVVSKEIETSGSLAFLDVFLHREADGSFSTNVYRKPTHTGRYLPYTSHHPTAQKLSIARTLYSRADNIITSRT